MSMHFFVQLCVVQAADVEQHALIRSTPEAIYHDPCQDESCEHELCQKTRRYEMLHQVSGEALWKASREAGWTISRVMSYLYENPEN